MPAISHSGNTPFAVLMKMLNMGDSDAVEYFHLNSKKNLAKWKSGASSPPQRVMKDMYELLDRVHIRAHEVGPAFTAENGSPIIDLDMSKFLPLPEKYNNNQHDKLPNFAEYTAYILAFYYAQLGYFSQDYDD